jgi:hypothetical protein
MDSNFDIYLFERHNPCNFAYQISTLGDVKKQNFKKLHFFSRGIFCYSIANEHCLLNIMCLTCSYHVPLCDS